MGIANICLCAEPWRDSYARVGHRVKVCLSWYFPFKCGFSSHILNV